MNPASTQADETLLIGEDSLSFLVTSEMSEGAVVACDVRIPAGGGPPMLHRHAAEELYRVETGRLSFYVADGDDITRTEKRAGEVAYIPGSVEHTIRNESADAATAFVVFSGNAAPMESFARDAAALAGNGPPKVESIIATAERHGVEITRPAPAAP